MSLINQMLKDLEGRSTQSAPSETVLTGLQATTINKKTNKKRYLLILGFLSLLFVWVWNLSHYYRVHYKTAAKLENPNTAVVAKVETPVPKVAAVETTPTQKAEPLAEISPQTALTGITMQAHGKMTYLRFVLDREAFYQINSDPLEHSIIISLKNTHLTVNVPPLDYVNSALSDIKVSSENKEELKIILTLKPEAKLSNLELNKEGKYPELQADFLMEAPVLNNKETGAVTDTQAEQNPGILKKVAVEMSSEEKYQEALNLEEAGEHEKATHLLAVLVDKYPEYNQARESLISLLIQQGKQEKAEELLADGLLLQPFYPPFIEFKAHFLVDEGRINQALTLLKKSPPSLATNPEYYAFIAALYQRLGQLPSAENLYQQLTTLHPEKGVWWLGLGVTQEGLGKNAQALEAYAKAERSQDLDPELRGYVGTRLRG